MRTSTLTLLSRRRSHVAFPVGFHRRVVLLRTGLQRSVGSGFTCREVRRLREVFLAIAWHQRAALAGHACADFRQNRVGFDQLLGEQFDATGVVRHPFLVAAAGASALVVHRFGDLLETKQMHNKMCECRVHI